MCQQCVFIVSSKNIEPCRDISNRDFLNFYDKTFIFNRASSANGYFSGSKQLNNKSVSDSFIHFRSPSRPIEFLVELSYLRLILLRVTTFLYGLEKARGKKPKSFPLLQLALSPSNELFISALQQPIELRQHIS